MATIRSCDFAEFAINCPPPGADWICKLGALCGLLGITTAQRRRREAII